MMPRSSRSHSTQVPADSMMASVPQVGLPADAEGDDREWSRPVPGPRWRRACPARRTGRACRRCRRWPWPARAGCSPGRRARPAGRRPCRRSAAPRQGSAGPTAPDESTMVGSIGSGMRSVSQQRLVPSDRRRVDQAGHAGVGGVGDVERRARPDEGPGHPGVDGAEAELAPLGPGPVGIDLVEDGHHLGGRGVGGQPDALGLELEAGADGAQVLPADARADRARRWRGPTRWSRPAGWRCPTPSTGPPSAERGAGHLEHGVGHGGGVELDQAGSRGVGQHRDVVDRARRCRRGARRRRARPRSRRRRPGCSPARSWPGRRAEGRGRPSLPGLRIPGVEGRLDRGQHVEARARGRRAGSGPG